MPSHMEPLNPDRPRYQQTPATRLYMEEHEAKSPPRPPRNPFIPVCAGLGLIGAFLIGVAAHSLITAPLEVFVVAGMTLALLMLLPLLFTIR